MMLSYTLALLRSLAPLRPYPVLRVQERKSARDMPPLACSLECALTWEVRP